MFDSDWERLTVIVIAESGDTLSNGLSSYWRGRRYTDVHRLYFSMDGWVALNRAFGVTVAADHSGSLSDIFNTMYGCE